jgi:hypothetical protein
LVASPIVRRPASIAVWVAFVGLSRGGAWLTGLPLGRVAAAALLAIAWIAWRRRDLPGVAIVAAALVVKTALAVAAPFAGGLQARYFANPDWLAPVERSVEFPRSAATRIDDRLDFAAGTRDLPLAFFNDIERFNFDQPSQPDRTKLPFSVVWDGYWWIDRDRTARQIYVDAPKASAELTVDAWPAVTVAPLDGPRTASVTLRPGWRRLQIHFSSPYGAPRIFSAGEIVGDARIPFDGRTVAAERAPEWRVTAARIRRAVATILDACVLGWLAVLLATTIVREVRGFAGDRDLASRRQRAFALFAIAAIVEALVFAAPWAGRLMLLGGGGDPLTYEFDARDILLNGPLMTVHALIGKGEPFYYQPLYPYFLALCHALFGEGMFGVLLVQRLMAASLVWTLTSIAVAIGGGSVWLAAAASAVAFAYLKMAPLADVLLNESLYLPMLGFWLWALLDLIRRPEMVRAARAGVFGGITALARAPIVVAWPLAVWACVSVWKSRVPVATMVRLAGVMTVASVVIVGTATLRNWIVSRQFVPIASSLPQVLYVGNEPPPTLTIDLTEYQQLYDWLGLHTHTRLVAEYARRLPREFARHLLDKALYTLGIFEPLVPGRGISFGLIAIWMLALRGMALSRRRSVAPAAVRALPALMAATHFIIAVVLVPHVYGERLILPFYLLLLAYSAIAVHHLVAVFSRRLSAAALALGRDS